MTQIRRFTRLCLKRKSGVWPDRVAASNAWGGSRFQREGNANLDFLFGYTCISSKPRELQNTPAVSILIRLSLFCCLPLIGYVFREDLEVWVIWRKKEFATYINLQHYSAVLIQCITKIGLFARFQIYSKIHNFPIVGCNFRHEGFEKMMYQNLRCLFFINTKALTIF